uniref:Uncharacterized protein n=1 Tax=Anopheles melas TaxID=34690 RepID=A0A182UE34_9DIPT
MYLTSSAADGCNCVNSPEELSQIHVVRALLEAQTATPLPRQRAAVEVHHHVPERLHVVAAALLDAEVRIDRGVARRAGQVLVLPVRDVDAGAEVAVLLRQAEVDQEQLVAVPPDPHQEVVRLDVPVDEVLHVQILQPADHLVDQHQHGLDCEVPAAEVEQILERGAEQIHHQHVVAALLPEVADVRDADAPGQHLVQLVLVRQLRVAGQYALHLQRHLLAIGDVNAEMSPNEPDPILRMMRYLPATIKSFILLCLSLFARCFRAHTKSPTARVPARLVCWIDGKWGGLLRD